MARTIADYARDYTPVVDKDLEEQIAIMELGGSILVEYVLVLAYSLRDARAELAQLRTRHDAEFAALLSDVADMIDIVWRGGGVVVRERIPADAARALDVMLERAQRKAIEPLRSAVDDFAEVIEEAAEALGSKTGLQVPYCGDFAGAQPSVIGALRQWAKRFRETLGGEG